MPNVLWFGTVNHPKQILWLQLYLYECKIQIRSSFLQTFARLIHVPWPSQGRSCWFSGFLRLPRYYGIKLISIYWLQLLEKAFYFIRNLLEVEQWSPLNKCLETVFGIKWVFDFSRKHYVSLNGKISSFLESETGIYTCLLITDSRITWFNKLVDITCVKTYVICKSYMFKWLNKRWN